MLSDSRASRIHPSDARFTWWEAPDGQRIRRFDWPQPKATQRRGHLVFAGGRGDFIEKYLESYAHWHQAGWSIAAFDWRGQGLSRGPNAPENPESFDTFIDDFAAILRDWRKAAGDDGPFVAVGHSMGGHLLLRTMIEHSPALDAAVLVAPMLLVNSAPVPDWLGPNFAEMMCLVGLRGKPMWKTAKVLNRPGSQRQRLLTASRDRYEDELWWWEQQPDLKLGVPTWGWMRAAYRSSTAFFTPDKLRRVKTPLLFMATKQDRLVSPAAIDRIAALLPDAEVERFDEAAHEILREEDRIRDRAFERIDSFLAARAP